MGLTLIDLKKAFDTVDHGIPCSKLEHYGIQQRGLGWFESYLYNRRQFCRVNGINSQIEKLEVGAPQGSCLCPLLFLIYINDLPHAIQNSAVSMYADDRGYGIKHFLLATLILKPPLLQRTASRKIMQ